MKFRIVVLLLLLVTKAFSLSVLNFSVSDDREYYNQGLAYAEKNDFSLSILYFKRAHLLKPLNKKYAEALNRMRSFLDIPTQLFELGPVEKILLFPFFALGINLLLILGVVFLFSGSIFLSLIFLNFIIKKLRVYSVILIGIGLLLIFSSVLLFNRTFDSKLAIVLQDSGLLHTPDSDAKPLSEISAGFECRVERSMGNFYLIKSVDGQEGWINKTHIRKIWQD